jgi:hypothetical protein
MLANKAVVATAVQVSAARMAERLGWFMERLHFSPCRAAWAIGDVLNRTAFATRSSAVVAGKV